MITKTTSQRGAANRRKGAAAELAVAKWLRLNGFGGAERAVRTGYRTSTRVSADPGDLTGTPGLVWSIKDCAVERLDVWLAELDAMRHGHDLGCGATIGLLVHKRRGHADPGRWWCWLTLSDLLDLGTPRRSEHTPTIPRYRMTIPVRLELAHVIEMLRTAGYGDPITEAA